MGIESTAATWVVDSWAIALGVITHELTTHAGPLRQGSASPTTYNAIPIPASQAPALIVSKIGPEHFHSIGEAVAKAKPGSRILVYPGLYEESVVLDKDLEIVGEGSGHDVIIAPPDNAKGVVMATAYAVVRNISIRQCKPTDGKALVHAAVVAGQGRLVLQHLAITAPASVAVYVTGAAASCLMHNVSLTGSRWGLWVTNGAEATIEGSTISECDREGVEIRDDARCIIRSSEVHGCGVAGISVVGPKGELLCEDTAVHDNRGFGIRVLSNARNRITGCEIVRNSMAGVALDEAASARIRHTQLGGNGGVESSQIEVRKKSGVVLQSCVISGGESHGMRVSTGSDATIEDSTFQGFGQECLSVFDGSSVTCDRSRFLRSKSFCVCVFQKCQAILRHCEIGQSATRSAIIVQAESFATLDHCQVREAKHSGVYACDRSKATVSASTVHECGSNGMTADKESTLQVEKCVIEGCNGVGVRVSQESTGEISDTDINGLNAFYVTSDSRRSGAGNSHNGTALLQACCEKCNTITEASNAGILQCCNPECGVRFRIDADGDVSEYFTDDAVTEHSETKEEETEEEEEGEEEEDGEEEEEEEEEEEGYSDEEEDEADDEDEGPDDDQDSGEVAFESPVELVCDECGKEWEVEESGITLCPRDDCDTRYVVDTDGDVTQIEKGGPYEEEEEEEEEDEEDEEEDGPDDDQASGEVEFESPVELVCDECSEEWEVAESGVTLCPRDDCDARYVVDADGDVTRIEEGGPYEEEEEEEEEEEAFKKFGFANFQTRTPPEASSIGMELIEILAGKFTMGSPAGEKDRELNEEQVAVTLTKPFLLGKTEVTQWQWMQVMRTEPWKGKNYVQADKDCPATFVSFFDAVEFCKELTGLERKAGKLKADETYRLPTEAEWEYACRAGTTTAFSFGDEASLLGDYGWFCGNTLNAGRAYAHKVGLKKPNPWRLHDMHGNMFEWCSDWHGEKLSGGTDPVGPEGDSFRVLRGGCWWREPSRCRSAARGGIAPSNRFYSLGFRVARSQSAQ